jgi:hypothetical protein
LCLQATAVVAPPPSWPPPQVAVARAGAVAVARAVARAVAVARVRVRAVARGVAVTVALGGNSDGSGGNTTIN